jgi:hypothetical protein
MAPIHGRSRATYLLYSQPACLPDLLARSGRPAEFANLMATSTFCRKLCLNSRGYIGLVPSFAEVGGAVFLIRGAQVPFVLRTVEGPLSSEGSRVLYLVGEGVFSWIDVWARSRTRRRT